jgi:hypothetical protein
MSDPAIDRLIADIVSQSVFALGWGASMPIQRAALSPFIPFITEQTERGLVSVADEETAAAIEKAWSKMSREILDGYKMVGIYSRNAAIVDASDAIRPDHLREAYNTVTERRRNAGHRPILCGTRF